MLGRDRHAYATLTLSLSLGCAAGAASDVMHGAATGEGEVSSGGVEATETSGDSVTMGPPLTPTDVQARAGATQIVVTWMPSVLGDPPDTVHVLLDDSEVAAIAAPAESATLDGLTPATVHRVSVVAENAGGRSEPSSELRVVTAFDPSAFPGTRLWLDADDASSFTLVADDRVSAWWDKSGRDNHAYQGLDSLMPQRVEGARAGRATVRFDDAYVTTSDVVQLREKDAGYTVFGVVMNTTEDGISGNEGRGGILLGNFGDNTPNVGIELHEDRVLRQWWDVRDQPGLPSAGNTGDVRFPDPRPEQSAFAILLFYRDGAAAKLGAAVDGELATELDDEGPLLSVTSPFRIGADYRPSPLAVSWNGDIAELLVFDRLLDADERLRLHEYLADKWSIALQ